MRILWLTENYPPSQGGMAQSCDRLVRHFRGQGVRVDLLHFTNRKKPFHREEQVNGSHTALPKHADMAHGLNMALRYLEGTPLPAQSDLLLAFGGLLPMAAAPVLAKLWGLPLYACLRGNDFDLSVFNYKRRPLLNEAIGQAAGIFAVSEEKARRVRRLYPDAQVHYTPNGIDLAEWQPLGSETAFAQSWRTQQGIGEKVVIGMFGYLKEKKGTLFFLRALLKSGMAQRAHLVLSGDPAPEAGQLLAQHHITHDFLPFIDRLGLIKHYLACDWVAIPSFYDGMPNVMLEAGGLGIPLLASAVDGMKDVLAHQDTALLFPPLDEGACAKAIAQAIAMPPKARHQLGQALKQHLANHFTARQEVARYLQILKTDQHDMAKNTPGDSLGAVRHKL